MKAIVVPVVVAEAWCELGKLRPILDVPPPSTWRALEDFQRAVYDLKAPHHGDTWIEAFDRRRTILRSVTLGLQLLEAIDRDFDSYAEHGGRDGARFDWRTEMQKARP